MKRLTTILLATLLSTNNLFATLERNSGNNFIILSVSEFYSLGIENPLVQYIRDEALKRTERVIGDKKGNETAYDNDKNITYEMFDADSDLKPDSVRVYIEK